MTAPQNPRVTPRALAEVACTLSLTASEVCIDCETRKEAEEVLDWLEAHVGHREAAEAASKAREAVLEAAIVACTAIMDNAALAIEGAIPDLDDAICCSGHDCLCRGSSNRELLLYDLRETARKTRAALTK